MITRFSANLARWPSFELDLEIIKTNILSKIHDDCLNRSPRCFLASLESIGLSVQEKKQKINFQDGCHGGHLGFLIGTILATFDLYVTPMLPTMFGVNWLLGLGEKAKNRFSRWPPWRPSWISDRHDFSYFWSTSHPDASYQVSSQLAQGCRRSRLLKQLLMPHDGRHTTDIDWLQ